MNLGDERLESQQLYDYCQLARTLAVNVATNCADTLHNHFLESNNTSNWQTIGQSLTEHMKQLIHLEANLNDSIQASLQTDSQIKQLIPDLHNTSDSESMASADINEIFEQKLAQISAQNVTNPEDNDHFKNLMNILNEFNTNPADGSDDDEDLQTLDSQPDTIPTDPFSKRPIEIPVRNKKCGHIYDREQLRQVLESRTGTGGRAPAVRCPTVGCNNKTVTLDDVEDDRKTRLLIDRLKRNAN